MSIEIENLTPKARRTRSTLLAAARTELGHRGVVGANVMAVCERAGIGRTSFYNYFEDAEALVSVVAQETMLDLKERFDHLHHDLPRGEDRLKACLRMILELAVEDPETILLLESLTASVPEIIELLETEIAEELSAFTTRREADLSVLGQFVALTVLAVARKVAKRRLPKHEIDQHIAFIMRACG
jgi:AcrR family transcriptional regulator